MKRNLAFVFSLQFYTFYGILCLTPVRERSLPKGAEIARTYLIKKWSQSGHVRIYLKIWKIYLDTCCLSRLFDSQTQPRIRRETAAIRQIIAYIDEGQLHWIASSVLRDEVNRNSDVIERLAIHARLNRASQIVEVGSIEIRRGMQLESLGFRQRDALHIACAEQAEADLFFTTDDQMLKIAKRSHVQLRVRIENPYTWLQEVTTNESI